jgi:ABC-2 type transport system ATP-binding protein
MLHLSNYKKYYGSFLVLEIKDLVVEQGIYWIKGKNGSGKSTLLQSLAGIIPCEGDCILEDSTSLKKNGVAYRRYVNFGDAEPIFPQFLTGKEMIGLFIEAKKGTKVQADDLVECFKMKPFLDDPLETYSSGMIKKLSLILAFIGVPKLILLDEPLITLDKETLPSLYELIVEKHRVEGISFFLSSHQNLESSKIGNIKVITVDQKTVKLTE